MKFIQTFYSGSNPNIDSNFGWLSAKYNLLSWTLSANQLLKFYDDVELYTDDFGYDLLINKAGLNYKKVHTISDNRVYRDDLWATAKIKTYLEQQEPFIHVDGDFYLWKSFPDEVLKQNILVQNIEEATNEYYSNNWNLYEPKLNFLGDKMCHFGKRSNRYAYNMGVFGVCDIDFIKRYSVASLDFVDNNIDSLRDFSLNNFNVFFEQVLLYEMACEDKKIVSSLLTGEVEQCNYASLSNFNIVPKYSSYTHLMATAKKHLSFCFNVLNHVVRFYPLFFYRIQHIYKFEEYEFLQKITDFSTMSIDNLLSNWFYNTSKLSEGKEESIVLRDLYAVGCPSKLMNAIEHRNDFRIKLSSHLEFLDDSVIIPMINTESLTVKLDKLDKIILSEIKNCEQYSQLIKQIESKYLDSSLTKKNKDKMTDFINKKLFSLVSAKVILLYPEIY